MVTGTRSSARHNLCTEASKSRNDTNYVCIPRRNLGGCSLTITLSYFPLQVIGYVSQLRGLPTMMELLTVF